MNSRFLLTMALPLLFAACSAAPQGAPQAWKPAAVFENGSLLIGSQRVELGAPVEAWIAALGSRYRFANPEIQSMIIWDDLGVAVYTDSTKDRHVKSVSFILRPPLESSGEFEPAGVGAQPRRVFPGATSLSRTSVDSMTRINDIMDRGDIGYSFYLSVDEQRYRSCVYNVNIAKAGLHHN